MNDTHGYLEPHLELYWDNNGETYLTAGGYARISALFKKIREEREEAVIALDSGDTLHGTYPCVHTKGEAMIEPLNLLKLDAWTVHWDFAYGVDYLRDLALLASPPQSSTRRCQSISASDLRFTMGNEELTGQIGAMELL